MSLADHIREHESFGCFHRPKALGIQKMPEGYALMLDADAVYFYWLRYDGMQSEIHWNKWAVRKGAMLNRWREEAEKADAATPA